MAPPRGEKRLEINPPLASRPPASRPKPRRITRHNLRRSARLTVPDSHPPAHHFAASVNHSVSRERLIGEPLSNRKYRIPAASAASAIAFPSFSDLYSNAVSPSFRVGFALRRAGTTVPRA